MKSAILFLSGLAVTFAGAFVRACTDGAAAEFALSWCGNAPPSHLATVSHAHCAGCVLVAGGLALVAVAPLFTQYTGNQVRGQART